MTEPETVAIYVGMFFLRCIAPLAFTLAIGYLMNRLADRWRAADELLESAPAIMEPGLTPKPGFALPAITVPCWIMKNCSPEMRADCPAYKQPGIPCWLVRLRVNGALPEDCPDCPIYPDVLVPAGT